MSNVGHFHFFFSIRFGLNTSSTLLQLYLVDKLMAVTFLFFFPCEGKHYTFFVVNVLCEGLVY